MKYSYKGMNIEIYESYDELSNKAAQIIAAQVILKPKSVLGLATGSTPERMYKYLVEMHSNLKLDFENITTFNLDEYLGITENNVQSYAYYMNQHLFNHININRDNINIPKGIVNDINGFCHQYDEKIASLGKIDLQVLGIGTNGHIGFNEPDVFFEAGTHLVKLDEGTIVANSRFFSSIDEVPKEAISIGIRNIMQSKKVILLASGKNKEEAVWEMIFGQVTPNLPASILQVHNDVTILLDKESGSKVKIELDKL